MAKYGAILAQGIIDAGGRNVTVSLQSRTGHTNLQAVVGMLIFTQYWYWFPLAHCLSLAFTPTCLIALNLDLKMPRMEFKSAARPSLYAYPVPLEEKKAEEREKVATAVLSIAARQKRRETVDKRDEEKMEVDEDVKEVIKDSKADDASTSKDSEKAAEKTAEKAAEKAAEKVAEKAAEKAAEKIDDKPAEKDDKKSKEDSAASPAPGTSTDDAEKEKVASKPERRDIEPNFEMLLNPARVLRQQLKVISLAEGQPYLPIKDVSVGGIVVTMPNFGPGVQHEDLVEPIAAHGPKGDESKEPEAPEPFEYNDE